MELRLALVALLAWWVWALPAQAEEWTAVQSAMSHIRYRISPQGGLPSHRKGTPQGAQCHTHHRTSLPRDLPSHSLGKACGVFLTLTPSG
jgi:hypothetical protein